MNTARLTTVVPLFAGQHLDRATFHEQYEAMPRGVRAELIGGVVFMPSPVNRGHSTFQTNAVGWLWYYSSRTPGVEAGDNASMVLDDLTEVQPDAFLRIKPNRGGQSFDLGNIISGAPELVVEVASSSKSTDLGPKLTAYEQAGAQEYIVFAIDPDEIYWHVRVGNRLIRIFPDPDGLYRSTIFPGLWLDPVALLSDDGPALLAALERGLSGPEHAGFVVRLSATGTTP